MTPIQKTPLRSHFSGLMIALFLLAPHLQSAPRTAKAAHSPARRADLEAFVNFTAAEPDTFADWMSGIAAMGDAVINVEFVESAPVPFNTLFDLSRKKLVFRVSRSFLRMYQKTPRAPEASVGRFLFMREVALAKELTLKKNSFASYLACAEAEKPTKECFDLLVNTHLAAAILLWEYADAHNLKQYFPHLSLTGHFDLNGPDAKEEAQYLHSHLRYYLLTGSLPNMFWAGRYATLMGSN